MPKSNSASASFTMPALRINARTGQNLSVGTLAIIASAISGVFGFVFLLIIGAQVGGNASLYGNLPATNITKITTNVANAVVTGSNFISLLYLGAGVALAASMIFLALGIFSRGRG